VQCVPGVIFDNVNGTGMVGSERGNFIVNSEVNVELEVEMDLIRTYSVFFVLAGFTQLHLHTIV
jgi:hypothetical protein